MILLKNATYIDWETLEFKATEIIVQEGPNGKILFDDDPEFRENLPLCAEMLDCSGMYVTKSFAVGHHHVYSALARGMGAPAKKPENFREILKYIWWTLDQALDTDMIEASALATAMAAAKTGSTFVIDHHASPIHLIGSLDIIANAFERVGVSHLLCYEITDRYGEGKTLDALAETRQYLDENQGLVGLHASFTVGEKTMKKAADIMRMKQTGVHIHVAEDAYDQSYCIENFGKRVVKRLEGFGVLESSKTILAHCLHMDDEEREILRNSPAWIVQNMESNLNNGVGYFNGEGLGERIFLGTDGMHSDMIRSAQYAFFAGSQKENIDAGIAYNRFRNVHHYLNQNNFTGDGPNNLVVLDYDSPTPFNKDNFTGHFLFGLNSNHVRHVISGGRLLVKNRQLQTVDEAEVLEFTKEQSRRLWRGMKEIR